MHVPLAHHRRVVAVLGIVVALLGLALGFELYEVNTLSNKYDEPTNTVSGDSLEAPDSPFLIEEEGVVIEPPGADGAEVVLPLKKLLFEYIEVSNSCGIHYQGECVNVRSGPGTDFAVVTQLRNNIVLKVDGKVERDDRTWYKIIFDEPLRYPERVTSDWYVSADYVNVLYDEGEKTIWEHGEATTTKHIVVDRDEQYLYAYEDGKLFLDTPISTGLELTPTPRGTFTIYKKTPSRYMQGPLPGLPADQYYDMPGVPWNLYFTYQGAVIHGAYWHDSFGSPYSHGCVNLPPDVARRLYNWAELGTPVIVK